MENGYLSKEHQQAYEQELRKRCQVQVYDALQTSWESIKDQIVGIEIESFGQEKAFDEDTLKDGFTNPGNTIVIVKDTKNDKIVGFTFAKPATSTYLEDFPKRVKSKRFDFMRDDAAYIYDTAFAREYQHLGLVAPLMQTFETLLKEKGYSYMDRDSEDNREDGKSETYADKVRKNYTDRIVRTYRHKSIYGWQRYFRIRLDKPQK